MNVEYHFNLFTKLGARHAVERWTIRIDHHLGSKEVLIRIVTVQYMRILNVCLVLVLHVVISMEITP